MKTVAKTNPYSDEALREVGAALMHVARHITGDNQKRISGAKQLVLAMMQSKGADLEKHTAVDQMVMKAAAEDVLRQTASGIKKTGTSDTWKNLPPTTTKAKNPGNSMGNNPAPDPPTETSQMTQQTCEDALEKGGITDADFRKQTCSTYLQQTPDTSALDPNQKGAHLVNASNNWLTTYDNLFSGGPISRPKYTAEKLDNNNANVSRSATVVQNEPTFPSWYKSTMNYRTSNDSAADLERAKLKTAKIRALKEASMDVKQTPGIRAIEAFHGR